VPLDSIIDDHRRSEHYGCQALHLRRHHLLPLQHQRRSMRATRRRFARTSAIFAPGTSGLCAAATHEVAMCDHARVWYSVSRWHRGQRARIGIGAIVSRYRWAALTCTRVDDGRCTHDDSIICTISVRRFKAIRITYIDASASQRYASCGRCTHSHAPTTTRSDARGWRSAHLHTRRGAA